MRSVAAGYASQLLQQHAARDLVVLVAVWADPSHVCEEGLLDLHELPFLFAPRLRGGPST